MAKYVVTIPASMHLIIEVEADDEKSAIEAAFDADFNINATHRVQIENFELHEHVGRGNVCEFASPWNAEAELIEEK